MLTRRVTAGFATMMLTGAIATIALAGPAGAGASSAPVTIEKVAVGAAPGTVFTIELTCETPTIIPPGGGDVVSSLEFTYTVDDTGNAVPDGVNTVGFEDSNDCTVTETDAAGAATTSYECEDNGGTFPTPVQFCVTNGPQADPIEFDVVTGSQEVLITVTNTFDAPPPPPAPIELEPAFTG